MDFDVADVFACLIFFGGIVFCLAVAIDAFSSSKEEEKKKKILSEYAEKIMAFIKSVPDEMSVNDNEDEQYYNKLNALLSLLNLDMKNLSDKLQEFENSKLRNDGCGIVEYLELSYSEKDEIQTHIEEGEKLLKEIEAKEKQNELLKIEANEKLDELNSFSYENLYRQNKHWHGFIND